MTPPEAGRGEVGGTADQEFVTLDDARAEITRLREINHELVCSHNDLLVVLTRLEAGQRGYGACACGNPTLLGVAHRSHECLTIGVQPRA